MQRTLKLLASIAVIAFATGCASTHDAGAGSHLDHAKNGPVTPLQKPEVGKGFQVYMSPFEIPPETEHEVFIYKNSPVQTTEYVNRIQSRMREGSHHFILYTLNGEQEGLKDGDTRTDIESEMQRYTREFAFGAQTENSDFTFPPGVAMELNAGHGLDLNSHYVNPTTDYFAGEAYINLYTVPRSEVQHIATPMLSVDNNFLIPANKTYTRKYNWGAFGKRTHLFLLTTHAHKRMRQFKVFKIAGATGDTTQIYNTNNWHEPDILSLDLVFEPSDEIYSETTWFNETDKAIRFGFTSEDEMNVLYGYFWQE